MIKHALGEAGFRQGRRAIDQLFTMRQVLEKAQNTARKSSSWCTSYTSNRRSIAYGKLECGERFKGRSIRALDQTWSEIEKNKVPWRMINDLRLFSHKNGSTIGLFNLVWEAVISLSHNNTEARIKWNRDLVSNPLFTDDVASLLEADQNYRINIINRKMKQVEDSV